MHFGMAGRGTVPLRHFLGPDMQAGIQERTLSKNYRKRVNRLQTREEEKDEPDPAKASNNKRRRTEFATRQENPAERG